MSWPQALAWRLGRQLLAEPGGSVVDAARQVAGVQAQVMSSAELAVGVRTARPPASVRTALWADRSLVKTWAMRGTLHLLPADELPIWVAALRAKENRPGGAKPGSATTASPSDNWGLTTAGDGTAALVTPAGAEALAAVEPVAGQVRLLPAFDTYVLAPRSHRRHTWPEGLHARISRPAGWITPVLLVDGRIAGVWAYERRAGSVQLEIEAFTPLSRSVRAAAETHARSYEALFDAPVEVSWA